MHAKFGLIAAFFLSMTLVFGTHAQEQEQNKNASLDITTIIASNNSMRSFLRQISIDRPVERLDLLIISSRRITK